MNGKGVHPVLICNVVKAAWNGSSGRVHKNIEAAKVFDHLVDTAAATCRVGYVGFEEAGRAAMTLKGREETLWRRNGPS
jgi:hypothetical protein